MAVLIDAEELNRCRTLNDIIYLVGQHLLYPGGGNRITSQFRNIS